MWTPQKDKVELTTFRFITAIIAVLVAITHVVLWHTPPIKTGVLVKRTLYKERW